MEKRCPIVDTNCTWIEKEGKASQPEIIEQSVKWLKHHAVVFEMTDSSFWGNVQARNETNAKCISQEHVAIRAKGVLRSVVIIVISSLAEFPEAYVLMEKGKHRHWVYQMWWTHVFNPILSEAKPTDVASGNISRCLRKAYQLLGNFTDILFLKGHHPGTVVTCTLATRGVKIQFTKVGQLQWATAIHLIFAVPHLHPR